MLRYANWGLAWRTNRTYGSGERRFICFCLMHRLVHDSGDIFPASEGTLIYFASYLARSVRHSTIRLYLAAVRNLHISCGHSYPLAGKLLLRKVLRGILRYQGQHRVLRQPVTSGVLLAIRPFLPSWLGSSDFSMVWAAFTLAFFGFLRCSEFTYQGVNKYCSRFELNVCHLYLAWLARSTWSLPFGRLRPTLFAQVSLFLLLGRTHRYVLSLPCSTIFSSWLLLQVPFLFFGLVVSLPGLPLLPFCVTPHVMLDYPSTALRVIVFALVPPLQRLLPACQTG